MDKKLIKAAKLLNMNPEILSEAINELAVKKAKEIQEAESKKKDIEFEIKNSRIFHREHCITSIILAHFFKTECFKNIRVKDLDDSAHYMSRDIRNFLYRFDKLTDEQVKELKLIGDRGFHSPTLLADQITENRPKNNEQE